MGLIQRLLKKKEAVSPRSAEYRFLEIDAADLDKYSTGITDIKDRKIDGFLIRNVLTHEESLTLVENLKKVDPSKKSHVNEGLIIYPKSFAQVDQSSQNSKDLLKAHYHEAEGFWNEFTTTFGVDYVGRVQSVLEKIADGRELKVPLGVDSEGHYNPATFKEMFPGKGELKAHCGNLFHNEFPTFYSHLMETSIIKNQMSYFVMLSPSEGGGELTLYDLQWDHVKKRLHGDTVLVDDNGTHYDLLNERQVTRKKLAPNAGDMIVFAGGQIWHKVEFIEGTKPRYTLGGFLSPSKDDRTVYFWS